MTDPLGELKRKFADAIKVVSQYTSTKGSLNEILAAYGVSSPSELLEKIRAGELPEHPTYEDYLEAKSLWEDLEGLRRRIREIIETVERICGIRLPRRIIETSLLPEEGILHVRFEEPRESELGEPIHPLVHMYRDEKTGRITAMEIIGLNGNKQEHMD